MSLAIMIGAEPVTALIHDTIVELLVGIPTWARVRFYATHELQKLGETLCLVFKQRVQLEK